MMFLRIPAMKPSFAARRRTSRLRGLLMSGTLFHLHAAALHAAEAPVFCNPLDLPLAAEKGWRHAADPVLVFYQNRWWLFTTWDFDGYRVSDDLLNWRDVRFDMTPLAVKSTTSPPPTPPVPMPMEVSVVLRDVSVAKAVIDRCPGGPDNAGNITR